MNVLIFQTGEPLHTDNEIFRPMRCMNLANALLDRGHHVTIWSSAFFHQQKMHRSRNYASIILADKLTINLVPSPGYRRNIGLGRIWDHAVLAWNLWRLLNTASDPLPDIAFVGYPPIEAAAVIIRWLGKRSVPVVLDVKDQWPTLFLEPFPRYLKPIISILLAPYYYYAHRAFREAFAFSTMSYGYLNWISRFSERQLTPRDTVSPLTAPIFPVSDDSLADAQAWWSDKGVSSSTQRRFCFVGSFMSVFDFTGIRDAAQRFLDEGIDCQLVICGDGGYVDEIHKMMHGLSNVILPGWIDEPKKVALAMCSSGSLIPYKNIDNYIFNLPNKVIDALAYGLPVLTSLSGELKTLIESEDIGFFCSDSSGETFYDAMIYLLDNENICADMSSRAFALYQERFSFDKVYSRLVSTLEILAK
jgi:glycosyltransferase involved in cell wall biosynthesis